MGLAILCATWILSMLVGHDPWKPDEAYSFGLVLDQLERGDWVVPMLAGEPFLEKPPLFFITAAGFARVFGDLLPLHDAARLASGFFLALALVFLALTAHELNRVRHGWTAVLVLLGCLGLYFRAHQLITDLALFAGISIGMFGFACGRHRRLAGGFALGAGAAIAFLSKGLLGPGILGITALVLPLVSVSWRNRNYAGTLALAAVVALPPIAAWTIALYVRSPQLFYTWLVANNFGRFLGFADNNLHQPPFFYAYTIIWYAFPALPLAGWALWHAHRRDGIRTEPALQMPLILCVVTMSVLAVAADARELYLMPVLLPLALMAGIGTDHLPLKAITHLDLLGKWVFGIPALALWLGWLALIGGEPAEFAGALAAYHPGFVARISWPAFVAALLATALWVGMTWPRATTARGALIQWTGGITLSGVLIGALWLPYLDAGKSYRGMIASLLESMPDVSCVASRNLGEPQRALLYYFGRLKTVRHEMDPNSPCEALFVQGSPPPGEQVHPHEWTLVWEGARTGDRRELYRLFVRRPAWRWDLTGATDADHSPTGSRIGRSND